MLLSQNINLTPGVTVLTDVYTGFSAALLVILVLMNSG